jgi:hypothetical protein
MPADTNFKKAQAQSKKNINNAKVASKTSSYTGKASNKASRFLAGVTIIITIAFAVVYAVIALRKAILAAKAETKPVDGDEADYTDSISVTRDVETCTGTVKVKVTRNEAFRIALDKKEREAKDAAEQRIDEAAAKSFKKAQQGSEKSNGSSLRT